MITGFVGEIPIQLHQIKLMKNIKKEIYVYGERTLPKEVVPSTYRRLATHGRPVRGFIGYSLNWLNVSHSGLVKEMARNIFHATAKR